MSVVVLQISNPQSLSSKNHSLSISRHFVPTRFPPEYCLCILPVYNVFFLSSLCEFILPSHPPPPLFDHILLQCSTQHIFLTFLQVVIQSSLLLYTIPPPFRSIYNLATPLLGCKHLNSQEASVVELGGGETDRSEVSLRPSEARELTPGGIVGGGGGCKPPPPPPPTGAGGAPENFEPKYCISWTSED